MVYSSCHPDKLHEAHGLCQNCYKRSVYDPVKASQKNRRALLKYYYGITPEIYEEMLQAQNGVCAICKRAMHSSRLGPKGKLKHLAVDHDHKTGVVRGLLCTNCNRSVGWYENVKTDLQQYLRED